MIDTDESVASKRAIKLKKNEIHEREQWLKRCANPLSVDIATAIIALAANGLRQR